MEKQIGPYEILGKLAAGGMATVYVGRHTRLGHVVGIKILHPHYQQDEQLRVRFVDEARIQANLRHPNILGVQDILELPEASAMVMELLSGCALDTFYRRRPGPLAPRRVLALFLPLVEALRHAHELGVVHRDLKPANVFLDCAADEVTPKLMDFGIAKLTAQTVESQVTAAGSMLGTPQYMAPEQFEDSSKVDARADQFSLGVMLYEALTGKVPFGGEQIAEIMKGILTVDPPPPGALAAGVPAVLEAITMRALSKQREERFASMAELAAALKAAAAELGMEAIPAGEVPHSDLREKGIHITTQISSSKGTPAPAATAVPQSGSSPVAVVGGGSVAAAPQQGPVAGGGEQYTPTTVEPPGAGRSSRLGLWLGLVGLLAAGAALAVIFWPEGATREVRDQVKAAAQEVVKAAAPVDEPPPELAPLAEKGPAPPAEPAPLPEIPSRAGVQLGRRCSAGATGLADRVINSRLDGGWRGERLSQLTEEQLNQLGLKPEELERFRAVRKENTLVREVDQMAIAASVTPFKKRPLSEEELTRLEAQLIPGGSTIRWVETKADYLCRMLPLKAAGNDAEQAELYRRVTQEHGFETDEFRALDGMLADNDRLLEAELKARAVCCLLKLEEFTL